MRSASGRYRLIQADTPRSDWTGVRRSLNPIKRYSPIVSLPTTCMPTFFSTDVSASASLSHPPSLLSLYPAATCLPRYCVGWRRRRGGRHQDESNYTPRRRPRHPDALHRRWISRATARILYSPFLVWLMRPHLSPIPNPAGSDPTSVLS